jgi:hypothetical protein
LRRKVRYCFNDDYDGIKELDNRVPPWFNYLFYGSILFAVYYMLDYHVFESSPLQEAEYAQEMETARIQREQLAKSGAFITEETVTFVNDSDALSERENYCMIPTALHVMLLTEGVCWTQPC